MGWLGTLEPHWIWLGFGLLLAVAEIAIPGFFLIWLAGAAIIVGALAWALPLDLAWQIVIFAVLAIVAVFLGRRYLRDNPIEAADPLMNDRGGRAVGDVVLVTSAISAGTGRVRLGDSEWLAKGPDAEAGTRMRVIGHDGVVLLVEHLH
jgi:inner membrane protein